MSAGDILSANDDGSVLLYRLAVLTEQDAVLVDHTILFIKLKRLRILQHIDPGCALRCYPIVAVDLKAELGHAADLTHAVGIFTGVLADRSAGRTGALRPRMSASLTADGTNTVYVVMGVRGAANRTKSIIPAM